MLCVIINLIKPSNLSKLLVYNNWYYSLPRLSMSNKNTLFGIIFTHIIDYFILLILSLYIYLPDSQESDGVPRPASRDAKMLLSACNLIEI